MFRFLFTILFAVSLVHSQSQQSWVDSLYTQMTLDQKIGQLFMVMAYPDGNNSKKMATSHQIQKQHIGGVYFQKERLNNSSLIPVTIKINPQFLCLLLQMQSGVWPCA